MSNDNVFEIKKPEAFVDYPITRIFREGAGKWLAQALEAEIEFFINQYARLKDESGKQRIVKNGCRPEGQIQSGIGPVPVKAPLARDRCNSSVEDKRYPHRNKEKKQFLNFNMFQEISKSLILFRYC